MNKKIYYSPLADELLVVTHCRFNMWAFEDTQGNIASLHIILSTIDEMLEYVGEL